ncbi:hypothetical protein G3I76_73410 [Streptomyces sp. SID11233]|nr:hypothetical protein [Streptomyces sp. SID11233]
MPGHRRGFCRGCRPQVQTVGQRPEHPGLYRDGAAGEAGVKSLQQFAGVGAHLIEPGDRVAGLGAQAHLPTVAFGPLGGDQFIEQFRRVAGHVLQDSVDRLGHQLQARQLPRGGQDVG